VHYTGVTVCSLRFVADRYGAGTALFLRVDVTSHTSFETAVRTCIDHFGGIDVIVNNAGVNGEDCWETQMQINLLVSGTFVG
jgi:NAD(P)-dependent dehydrogenase (short-subunit alcohol dehydrogenase family)